MKRFYTVAAATSERGVTLDGRPLRTPARALLAVPTDALAAAIADEWNAQGDRIDPRAMPLTGLANAAIDRVAPDPEAFARSLSVFAESELLAYRAEGPAPLLARQAAVWDPLLDWARQRYDIGFTLVTSILHVPQPPATLARITAAYAAFDAFRLAALNPVVTICGSAVIGLAVAQLRSNGGIPHAIQSANGETRRIPSNVEGRCSAVFRPIRHCPTPPRPSCNRRGSSSGRSTS